MVLILSNVSILVFFQGNGSNNSIIELKAKLNFTAQLVLFVKQIKTSQNPEKFWKRGFQDFERWLSKLFYFFNGGRNAFFTVF